MLRAEVRPTKTVKNSETHPIKNGSPNHIACFRRLVNTKQSHHQASLGWEKSSIYQWPHLRTRSRTVLTEAASDQIWDALP